MHTPLAWAGLSAFRTQVLRLRSQMNLAQFCLIPGLLPPVFSLAVFRSRGTSGFDAVDLDFVVVHTHNTTL